MKEKLLLGISGSPRKGRNTDRALEAAMTEAETVPGIKTEILYLRDYPHIHDCIGCYACCGETAHRDGGIHACPTFGDDDMGKIYPELASCAGLILASPVYFGTVSALMKRFMDRTEGLLRYGQSKYQYALQHKIGGGIAVGGNRNAGEEWTIQTMHYFFLIHDMVVTGSGGKPTPGCYIGGGATTWPNDKKKQSAVEDDALGLQSCRNLGRNIAETVMRIG